MKKHKITVSQRGACAAISLPSTIVKELEINHWPALKLEKVKGKKWEISEAPEGKGNRIQERKSGGKVYYYFYTTQLEVGNIIYLEVKANTKYITVKEA